VRCRPPLARIPTEANLRRARKQLQDIRDRIADGTFRFAEEFPDFRDIDYVEGGGAADRRTCNDVFDDFLKHAESRVSKGDLAFATLQGSREILEAVWRPKIGTEYFDDVKYSTLVKIIDSKIGIKKKTHNNI
jgi:integrase